MTPAASSSPTLVFLEDRWDLTLAATLDEPELLRYRSNLLGSDLRITNFAGGNTSSKIIERDPLTGQPVEVLWVKGSGGDLGSIRRAGFATLYQQKFLALEELYKGVEMEDEMVAMYPLCAFGDNSVAASIDTPLHGFLPFTHVDHLHPDWAIALAASANGRAKMEEFNRAFGHSLVWLPWLRPGFELGLRMRHAVKENPGCDGIVLGGHGLFTWGQTQRECYRKTLAVIDGIGQFIARHATARGTIRFGGEALPFRPDRRQLAIEVAPFLRGRLSVEKGSIASFTDAPDALQFVNSAQGGKLAFLGTSCPDHFIRTKIRPLFVPWPAGAGLAELKARIGLSLDEYRRQYRDYYHRFATPDSPALRDASPTVVLIPGLGIFSFGKNKTEARIAGEFYTNAIHVMEGATLLDESEASAGGASSSPATVSAPPQCGEGVDPASFQIFSNYVSLPAREAFRIEYWAMEEAKIRRQPPERELSRCIVFVVGAGGMGGEAILKAAAREAVLRGAHVVVADGEAAVAARVADELKLSVPAEFVASTQIDIGSRESIASALKVAVEAFGGLDILVDGATLPSAAPGDGLTAAQWTSIFAGSVTASPLLADEAAKLFAAQGLGSSITLIRSANSEPCNTKP
jgi:rhamnose utilization protein RhaD (predicted bifunctional aldolase and dehydrogenase)